MLEDKGESDDNEGGAFRTFGLAWFLSCLYNQVTSKPPSCETVEVSSTAVLSRWFVGVFCISKNISKCSNTCDMHG